MNDDLSLDLPIEIDAEAALLEDVGTGDLTAALVPAEQTAAATVISRESAVICGKPWFDEVFRQVDPSVAIDWAVAEGEHVEANQTLCTISGLARPILTAERSALNFLQLLSAVATAAGEYAALVAHTNATILDTRKTIPGLRLAQKYAVKTGGAENHRIGLYDAILIKENHIIAAGGIAAAVSAARAVNADVLVEVEVESLNEAEQAMNAKADRLLLDNFSNEQLREAVALRDRIAQGITLEASGGVNKDTVKDIAECGVDFISIGGLTKDVKAVDLSMRFKLSA